MAKWLLSIVGIAFISVLFDIIYPNGKLNTFCRSIFGVFAVIMMITPIFNLNLDDLNIDMNTINSDIVENINLAKKDTLKQELIQKLKLRNIEGVDVEINVNFNNNEMYIENIYVDIINLVLNDFVTNINKYEVISKEVAAILNVDQERVVIYG